MQLSTLLPAYARTGPTATAYLAPGVPDAEAASELRLRWRGLAEKLRVEGADKATVDAMHEQVRSDRSGHIAAEGLIVVAAGGEVLFADHLAGPVGGDQARWSPLPDLGPYVRANALLRRHVVVVVDRAGADLVVRDIRRTTQRHAEGRQHPLHKPRGGGWAHKRIHNKVEEVSEANARYVAREMNQLVKQVRPATVLLTGEVEARARVRAHLPEPLQRQLHESDRGSRSPGTEANIYQALAAAVEEAEQRFEKEVLDRLRSGLPASTAVEGMTDVLTACRQGAVDTLVLTTADPDAGTPPETARRLVAIGPDPLQLAPTAEELEPLLAATGTAEPRSERTWREHVDAAVIRAGAATDAAAVVTSASDAGLVDDIGALLRFALVTR